MAEQVLESQLRPAVELYSVAVSAGAALLCLQAPWAVALSPQLGHWSAAGFAVFGLLRLRQAGQVLRYRRHIRRLPRYALTSRQIPLSRQRLFMGRGFRWTRVHTQRLVEAQEPAVARYLRQPWPYRLARNLEQRLEHSPPPLSWLTCLTARDSPFNPLRPLPPVGGSPLLHGVEPNEVNVTLPLTERVGHTLVLGTTRVAKPRLAGLYITQDSHRGAVRIVFDPTGDADLLKRIYVEARRAGRERELYVFHLGWPDISCRYNAIGRFSRVTEVASRIAGQLSAEGNSAAFREFAWRFVNIIARALVDLGRRPDYLQIQRHVINIDALFIEYAEYFFARHDREAWPQILALESRLNERTIPRHMQGRERRVVAIEQYLATKRV